MFQGLPAIESLNYAPYAYNRKQLVGAILTHAHLDHCGRLPILLSGGYPGHIWMTPPTRDLTELSLLDSAKIAREDKKKILYDRDLAMRTVDRFKTTEYREPVEVGDFRITFRDAGHILGSAILEIEDTRSTDNFRKIVFSGDLGNSPGDLLERTELIESADAVVMESTYGDRMHPQEKPEDALQKEINKVEETESVLLIPAFSLERTQELLHMIMHLKLSGKVRAETPVFLDSPMAQRATRIYTEYPLFFNNHIRTEIENGGVYNFPGLEVVEDHEESMSIYGRRGVKVIIAGSGMMTGGRILGHAAYYLPIPSTRLFMVGYQAEDTLGRTLLSGVPEVVIDGMTVMIKATISSTQAMSSHADQGQLLDWLSHIQNVKKVFLTHGDDGPRKALSRKIAGQLKILDVVLPTLNQELAV